MKKKAKIVKQSIYARRRKPVAPPTIQHKDKKKYDRKNLKNDQFWSQ